MEKKWRRIGKGETIPTSSIIRPIDGGLPNITGNRVMIGQDCYYLSVDDAYELLKGLPLETEDEAKERNDATIIKKLIGLVKETEFLSEENRASLLDWLEKQGEQNHANSAKTCKDGQKPVWSEDDEAMLNFICANIPFSLNGRMWLKSLKYRVQPQPKHEWNEEDEKMIEAALQFAHEYGRHGLWVWLKSIKFRLLSPSMREFDKEEGNVIDHLIAICDDAMCYDTFAGCSKKDIEKYKTFLTNLKFGINPQPQTTWKPSDEQMNVLDVAIKNSHLTTAEYNGLVKLREQLKSL